jgi:hypothetical protein
MNEGVKMALVGQTGRRAGMEHGGVRAMEWLKFYLNSVSSVKLSIAFTDETAIDFGDDRLQCMRRRLTFVKTNCNAHGWLSMRQRMDCGELVE